MFMLTWSTSRVISLLSRLSDYSHSTPTVLRDTLGYYSTHYQFIRTPFWYELHSGIEWYSWVLLHPLSVHPLVPRDILGYYSTHYHFIRTSFRHELPSRTERHSWVLLHPLSVRQNSIPTWTTLWYWVIFLGITPPIICSSELHSDMNCAPSYIFCWTECLITILTVLIWTIWEPQGLPRSFIYTIAGIQFVFNNWTTYRIQCPLLLDVSLVVSSKARILDHMVPN